MLYHQNNNCLSAYSYQVLPGSPTESRNLPAMQKTQIQSLGQEDPLEKGMATHSSILDWRIPWAEEPGGLHSMGSQKVGHAWVINTHTHKGIQKSLVPEKINPNNKPCCIVGCRNTGQAKTLPCQATISVWNFMSLFCWASVFCHGLRTKALETDREKLHLDLCHC